MDLDVLDWIIVVALTGASGVFLFRKELSRFVSKRRQKQ